MKIADQRKMEADIVNELLRQLNKSDFRTGDSCAKNKFRFIRPHPC